MGREIGRIVEVRGVSVKAELYELLPPYLIEWGNTIVAPRINTFVKTKVGLDVIICQITGEYYDEQKKGQFTGYCLDLTVKGFFENDKFIQGVRMLPMVAASVELLNTDEFKRINECLDSHSFSLGTDLFDSNQKYFFSFNSIIPSHIGIFGNTGSGKSNTLARLLSEYVSVLSKERINNGKVLVIDINNEYGGNAICDIEDKIVYELSTRKDSGLKIPINYNELQEDEWCVLLNATEATQRPVIKTAYNDKRSESEYEDIIRNMIRTGQHSLIRSMQYHMGDYVSGIDGFKWHTVAEKFFWDGGTFKVFTDDDGIDLYLNRITVEIPEEKLKHFLFKLYFAVATHIGYGTQYEFISPMLRRAEKLVDDFGKVFEDIDEDLFGDKGIAVIQLANVNRDMMELIPSILVSHLFTKQIDKKEDKEITDIVNVVIDEAHNLLYEDELDRKHNSITIETFERAIKEGRKFGMFLWISSQRPSDISSTIISQMHNYFIHKLVNPYDLNKIRKAVAFLDQNSMDTLTVLGPGECVVSGTGLNMPCFLKVDQLDKEHRPNSENVMLYGDGGIFEKEFDPLGFDEDLLF